MLFKSFEVLNLIRQRSRETSDRIKYGDDPSLKTKQENQLDPNEYSDFELKAILQSLYYISARGCKIGPSLLNESLMGIIAKSGVDANHLIYDTNTCRINKHMEKKPAQLLRQSLITQSLKTQIYNHTANEFLTQCCALVFQYKSYS